MQIIKQVVKHISVLSFHLFKLAGNNFTVIKMMLHSLYFLVCFMTLTCNQDDISFYSQQTGSCLIASSRFTIVITFPLRLLSTPAKISRYYGFRIFTTWIVRSNDEFIAHCSCNFAHYWSFGFVSVSTCSDYSDYSFCFILPQLLDGSSIF